MSTSELDYITVKGFKSIKSIEKLKLGPINIIIGPNGSGKSNFIGVFSFLHEIREGRLHEYVRKSGGAQQLLFFGAKTTDKIEIHISFRDEINQYHIELQPTDNDDLFPQNEAALFWDKVHPRPYSDYLHPRENGNEAGISGDLKGTSDWVKTRLGRWRLYHVHDTSSTSPLRKTAKLNDNTFLRPDGSNLAAFLYLLKTKPEYQNSYQLIRKTIQRVAPFFDDFILEPDLLNEESIRLIWKHKNSDQYFNAANFSDGTLRFIELATLFLQPISLRPSVILVDEPELGLHPAAITILSSLIQQAAVETQVIISTQSSLLLDHFSPEDILVANRHEGSTVIERLNIPDIKTWLEDYGLGQLWEKNEFGGRPGSI
jgi:predicted ATPase